MIVDEVTHPLRIERISQIQAMVKLEVKLQEDYTKILEDEKIAMETKLEALEDKITNAEQTLFALEQAEDYLNDVIVALSPNKVTT